MSAHSISSLWIGNQLGQFEKLSLSSFVRRGYDVTLYSYEPKNFEAPEGVKLENADQILPKEMVFENRSRPGTFAGFSNIFRYRLLQLKDTTWCDSDVLAGPQALPDSPYLFGWESKKFINGAVLRAPKNSQLLAFYYREATSVPPEEIQWGQIGPRLVSAGVRKYRLSKLAQPIREFYPIAYYEVWKLFDPTQTEWVLAKTANSSAIHLWNEVFRNLPVKHQKPPEGSYMDLLFQELDVEMDSSDTLSSDFVRNTWRPMLRPRPFERGFMELRAGRVLRFLRKLAGQK